jgi:hypothetical protein
MMSKPFTKALALGLLLGLVGCKDKGEWVAERQKSIDTYRAGKQPIVAPTVTSAVADPYWDNPSFVKVRHERECPDGLWALFAGAAPGGTDENRQKNEAKRPELANAMKSGTFVTALQLGAGAGVKVLDYDLQTGGSPVEMPGIIDCQDSIGRISIAFTSPKAGLSPVSAAKEGQQDLRMGLWQAPALRHTVQMPAELSKELREQRRLDLQTTLTFHVRDTSVDVRTVSGEDWGAGRLVHATVDAVRVSTLKDQQTLLDTRKPSVATAPSQ